MSTSFDAAPFLERRQRFAESIGDGVALIPGAHEVVRDREMEIWNGRRAGPEGAMATYGADAAYPIEQFEQKLREYAIDRTAIYYQLGNPAYDPKITRLLTELRAVKTRGHTVPLRLEDPSPILHELRLRRSPAELARQRRACEIA